MIGWALRLVVIWGGIALAISLFWDYRPRLLSGAATHPSQARSSTPAATPPRPAEDVATDSLVFDSGPFGQFTLEATVNGAPIHFVVDTGASMVVLTPEDARAAGINLDRLTYNLRAKTANGIAPAAGLVLDEVRINGLVVYNVAGAVQDNSTQSLLGMSFLNRLKGYEIHDGRLTINW
jgi:aspartyl protease family protein